MANWKKVILEGADLSDGLLFDGNSRDLNTPAAGGLSVNDGTALNNVMFGNSSSLSATLKVNIMGPAAITDPQDDDFILIHDASDGADGALKRLSLANLNSYAQDGVTSVVINADGGTADSDDGAAAFTISGGTGLSTSALGQTVTVNADIATADATVTDATLGVAAFYDEHFNATDGFVKLATGGVESIHIANGTIVNEDIANNAAIADTKLADIDTIGKVKIQAIDIEDAAVNTSGQALQAADEFIIRDVSATTATDSGNRVFSLGAIQDFLDSAIGGAANAHDGIAGPFVGGGTEEGGGLTYIDKLTFDSYGHVTAVETDTVPNAAADATGVVTAGNQSFGGVKTFDELRTTDANGGNANLTVGGNVTVAGNLIVSGDTTTLNVTTLDIEDKTLVAALPAQAHDDTVAGYSAAQAAADGGGFFLASHHDYAESTDYYAGLTWQDGGKLTGWRLNNTADPDTSGTYDPDGDDAAEKFSVSVMSFGDSQVPTGDAAGIGSFHFAESNNPDNSALYLRVG